MTSFLLVLYLQQSPQKSNMIDQFLLHNSRWEKIKWKDCHCISKNRKTSIE